MSGYDVIAEFECAYPHEEGHYLNDNTDGSRDILWLVGDNTTYLVEHVEEDEDLEYVGEFVAEDDHFYEHTDEYASDLPEERDLAEICGMDNRILVTWADE